MLEDFLAQVVHRLLADPLHDADLHVLQAETQRASETGVGERQSTAEPMERDRSRDRAIEARER